MTGLPPIVQFRLSDIPAAERRTALHDVLSPLINVRFDDIGSDFEFTADVRALNDVTLVFGTNSSTVARMLDVGASRDEFILTWAARPCFGRLTHLGREVDGRDGCGLLRIGCDDFKAEMGTLFHPIDVRIPRGSLLQLAPNAEAKLMGPIPANDLGFALLRNYLSVLRSQTRPLDSDTTAIVAGHICDLVALALGAPFDVAEFATSRGIAAARLASAKQFITEHLSDPALSIFHVARAQGIGARYLQLLFDADGTTFSKYVLRERLTLVRRRLANPLLALRSISEIAFDAGFGDLSHFNRSFKAAYGETPSDLRHRSTAIVAPKGSLSA